jgi:hypothetical protein
MSVRTRLEKLETATGAGACPACGLDARGMPAGDVRFKVITGGEPSRPLRRCPGCGRLPIQFTLNIATAGREKS